jgi:AraC family transcriptional regulator of adaptative response/methylated-DNA-[protein]-cysteine methyltransferase
MTLAKHIRKPKAVRTIATAIGKNPLCWLIPCHRVLRTCGELGGYHWGLKVKRNMLAYEALAN